MRTTLVLLSSFVALALGAATAIAQERPAAAPAASMPMDCSSGGMKHHDHGAERNAPSTKAMSCMPQAAASGVKSKAKPTHDHAKIHKNQ
ncbi:hypothetical protein LRS03_04990 [Rhizobacter sp. J219]|jgi:hypothetical protein|uniref:hypothetical protein n=1 Tax=Rhizobacter sp. J219 TaxID=2898430 RepID=UPI00215190EE|nr:hypothetical protein [Rhizobacter sp. J219]MCR5882249.1 hypothetical protein [Rhizobacter sp. J219]